MSKKDCSELAKAVLDLAMNIAADPEVRDIDDVVAEIQKSFSVMPRNEIIGAIVDASASEQRESDELADKLKRIKREAKTDKALREKIESLEGMLEEGESPSRAEPRTLGPRTIEQYRSTAKNLRKWLANSDPVLSEKLQGTLNDLDQQIESGKFASDRAAETRLHDTLQGIQDQINIARQHIKDAKAVQKVMDEINALQQHLDQGTLPEKKPRNEKAPGPIDVLRDIRDDLRTKLKDSEPAQKKRLEDTISLLEARIKAGDFAPKARKAFVPQSKEVERLVYERDRLRRDIRIAIADLKPKSIWNKAAEPFNAIRAVMTSFDLSAVLRQGGVLSVSHPGIASKAIPDMLNALVSEQQSIRINSEILSRDNAPLYAKSKLYIAPIDGTERFARMEESFMSRWARAIPGVRRSERAYLTFLNKLRADTFDAMCESLAKNGEPTLDEAKAIATYINEATGRGGLGIEQAAVGLNVAFFAPKYTISRFQLLMGHPMWRAPNSARTIIAQEYAKYLAGIGVILALGVAAGGEIEKDPRSSDFLKIRFGNTRLDPMSGLSQTAVLLTRIVTRQTKSAGSGEIKPLTGDEVEYGGQTLPDVLARYLRTKLSPTFGLPLDLWSGKNVVGEKVEFPGGVLSAPVPLALGDIYEVMVEQGIPKGTVLSLLSIFGMGLQSYDPEATKYANMTDEQLSKTLYSALRDRTGIDYKKLSKLSKESERRRK